MNELLPCPFCGAQPRLVKRDVEPQGDPWYGKRVEEFIECECGCCLFDGGFHEGFYDAEDRAVRAWNTRTLVAQQSRAPYRVENVSSEFSEPIRPTGTSEDS